MLMFAFIELCYRLLLTVIGISILSILITIGIILLIIGIIKKIKYKKILKKKKYPTVLITLGSVFIIVPVLLVGTLVVDSVVHYVTREKNVTTEKKLTTEEKCEIIINAVQNKEKEPIKELFCENANNTHDLDTELDAFINFIDGNIVSYDQPGEGGGGISSTREDGLIKKSVGGYIENILTDTGNLYTIAILSYDVYKEYPEFIGVVSLSVIDENKHTIENTDNPEEYLYRIDIDRPR